MPIFFESSSPVLFRVPLSIFYPKGPAALKVLSNLLNFFSGRYDEFHLTFRRSRFREKSLLYSLHHELFFSYSYCTAVLDIVACPGSVCWAWPLYVWRSEMTSDALGRLLSGQDELELRHLVLVVGRDGGALTWKKKEQNIFFFKSQSKTDAKNEWTSEEFQMWQKDNLHVTC